MEEIDTIKDLLSDIEDELDDLDDIDDIDESVDLVSNIRKQIENIGWEIEEIEEKILGKITEGSEMILYNDVYYVIETPTSYDRSKAELIHAMMNKYDLTEIENIIRTVNKVSSGFVNPSTQIALPY